MDLWSSKIPGYSPKTLIRSQHLYLKMIAKQHAKERPQLTPYLINDGKQHAAIVICPGGGYSHRAEHEGTPIALWLNSLGISAFVLSYRVSPYRYPFPLMDAQRAIRLVRFSAIEWNIDPDKIGILGFSAGGHLASSVGTHYDFGAPNAIDPIDRQSCYPNCMILCYPVISFGPFRHSGSMKNLLGKNPDPKLVDLLSNETQVTPKTPPTFLWHTEDDATVPVENSKLFADALRSQNVLYELHLFPNGRHGLGLAKKNPVVGKWTSFCSQWLDQIFDIYN